LLQYNNIDTWKIPPQVKLKISHTGNKSVIGCNKHEWFFYCLYWKLHLIEYSKWL